MRAARLDTTFPRRHTRQFQIGKVHQSNLSKYMLGIQVQLGVHASSQDSTAEPLVSRNAQWTHMDPSYTIFDCHFRIFLKSRSRDNRQWSTRLHDTTVIPSTGLDIGDKGGSAQDHDSMVTMNSAKKSTLGYVWCKYVVPNRPSFRACCLPVLTFKESGDTECSRFK